MKTISAARRAGARPAIGGLPFFRSAHAILRNWAIMCLTVACRRPRNRRRSRSSLGRSPGLLPFGSGPCESHLPAVGAVLHPWRITRLADVEDGVVQESLDLDVRVVEEDLDALRRARGAVERPLAQQGHHLVAERRDAKVQPGPAGTICARCP